MTQIVDAPPGERTPPQDGPAEQCVLGGMLLSKDAIGDVVEILKPGDFYHPKHATIFSAIVDMFGRGEPADAITVSAALTDVGDLVRVGGAPYLHTLIAAVPTAANASYYARIVAGRATLRRVIEAGTRVVQLGHGSAASGGGDPDTIVDVAQQIFYDLGNTRADGDGFEPIGELWQPALDEIEAAGAAGAGMRGIPTGFADLDRLLNGLSGGQLVIFAGRPGAGKALALDTPLPTPDGWTTMGEVREGDRLLDANGCPTAVLRVSDVQRGRDCYEVVFSDGSTIVADADHLWKTWDHNTRRAYAYAHPDVTRYPPDWTSWEPARSSATPYAAGERSQMRALRMQGFSAGQVGAQLGRTAGAVQLQWNRPEPASKAAAVRTTEEIAATLRVWGAHNHSIPAAAPLDLPAADLPMDPYILGYFLGDGSTAGSSRRVACDPRDRQWLIEAFRAAGYDAAPHASDGHFGVRGISQVWRDLGLSAGKHVPSAYLRASLAQRLALMQGLIDSDGYVDNHGSYRFTNTNKRLIDAFAELATSIGCVPHVRRRAGRVRAGNVGAQSWEVVVPSAVHLARLPRKVLAARLSWKREQAGRYITDVRPVASVPVRCVVVDNADHMYLAGRTMIPTHNSTAALDVNRYASIKHNLASAIFSMEMSKTEIVMRVLSAESRVPLQALRSGQLTDEDWTRLARRMGEIGDAPIFVDDSASMTLMEIRAKARRLKQRHDLKLIVVDYLQLMATPGKTESRQQEVAGLSRGLKLLAKEINVPVIAVSQINRGPEGRQDKRPQLSDLRESGSIENDADVVMMIHRDDYYDKESPRAGEADFIVAKHRNGPTDTVTVAAQLHLSRFVDMALG